MTQGATQTESGPRGVPGGTADKPSEVPAKGWKQIAKRGWAEAKDDQVPLLAAGVAFYAFLAIFPAIIAAVIIYGLVADPATISSQIGQIPGVPAAVKDLVTQQLTEQSGKGGGAVLGAVLPLLLALWSASGGVGNLMTAISTAYDEKEERGFIKKRAIALALTIGAIVVMLVMLGLVAVIPALLNVIDLGPLNWVINIGRWLLLVVVIAAALAVLYRVAPDRDAPKMRWVSVGAGVATVLWVIASIGFSIYAGMGGYANTYGAVAGIVVLLFWLWITAYAILLGAEINAEAEQQTAADTTKGPAQPMGERDAVKADSLPGEGSADSKPAKKK